MKMKNILIINSAEKDIHEFYQSIEEIFDKLDVYYQSINYSETLNFDFDSVDGVIISGSPRGDDVVKSHQPYFQWVRNFDKPIMGMCAGHHVLGVMFGAEYFYSKEPEKGKVEIEILVDDPIYVGLGKTFIAYEMHNDSISVPVGFIHLSKSKTCFNQAMKHVQKPIYTFQFHPEFLNHQIFTNFIGLKP